MQARPGLPNRLGLAYAWLRPSHRPFSRENRDFLSKSALSRQRRFRVANWCAMQRVSQQNARTWRA